MLTMLLPTILLLALVVSPLAWRIRADRLRDRADILRADIHSVRTRAYLGPFREIPWELIVAVQFPDKLRFARLVLPGEETIALYAVQRFDRERSVAVMRDLRALYEAASTTPSSD